MTKPISEWRGEIPALTTTQMREVDRAMMDDLGITLMQMMENAGRHLATLAREKLGGNVESKRIVVLAGRGNNGGGGLVAARRLASWGADVCVVLAASPNEYQNVPAHQLAILQRMGVVISQSTVIPPADLILDCLIGYGLRGAPQGVTADLIRQANESGTLIIALDTPSGLDTTTGDIFDPCIRADATLTLALLKVGLLTDAARAVAGELYVADIGVPAQVYTALDIDVPNLFAEHEIVHIQS
ncbi:Bifunctional NAD(P)H-hydrate repair enzyme Nnr [Anaerolineae bacterium]|nr:Bifunctional NAD(P)H-hydrate repair enzyme Nnr [Anaerolineae bacterium]